MAIVTAIGGGIILRDLLTGAVPHTTIRFAAIVEIAKGTRRLRSPWGVGGRSGQAARDAVGQHVEVRDGGVRVQRARVTARPRQAGRRWTRSDGLGVERPRPG